MTRIGIFGGSFNPIHNGHIALARQLRRQTALDEVWLMVSPQNPLKLQQDLLEDHLRMQLVRTALQDEPGIVACDYEMRLPKPSYTWNTLQALSRDFPDHRFTLLIGGDNWALFHRWYHADDIASHYDICIYPRRGSHLNTRKMPPRVRLVEAELLDISSTEIRRRVSRHEDISGMVPDSILDRVLSLYDSTHDKPAM